jgi:hypothetical protein
MPRIADAFINVPSRASREPQSGGNMSVPLEQQITRTAHHEAGHLVAAAALGLKLRSEGLAVDARGEGLACYCKQAGDSDERRESVIVATFSGYNSELQLCSDRDYPKPDSMQLIFSCDAREARPIIAQLSYLSVTRTAFQIEEELQNRSRMLVKQEWQAIRVIADALLEREWEPVQPLPSGGVWSQEQMAKHLNGKEVVGLLSQFGIRGQITDQC